MLKQIKEHRNNKILDKIKLVNNYTGGKGGYSEGYENGYQRAMQDLENLIEKLKNI
jgi:hypothetical protein